MRVAITHNPACGTSRNVLKLLQEGGHDVEVIPYLDTGWTRAQLTMMFAAAGVTPRQALRTSKSPAEELGLLNEGVSDEALIDAMLAHPVLVNRPFVATRKGTKLCRPSGEALDLIDPWPPAPFAKEDGSLLINAAGERMPE